MNHYIKEYIRGCALCQQMKVNTHPTVPPIQPIQPRANAQPFHTVTMDFITGLPPSKGFDSLMVVVDHDVTKAIVLIPCTKTIDALGTATFYLHNVFRRFGLPKHIISDRGPQFASRTFRALWARMGVKMAMSTAYHPQTDGASERINQVVEQYLRAYCNRSQNNWAKLLPIAEMTYNAHKHSATKKTPFELLYGYVPSWPTDLKIGDKIPTAEERIESIKEARKESLASLKIAEESMKQQYNQYGKEGPQYVPGNKVWLEGKNLKTQYPSAKLAPRRYGPFKIDKPIGTGAYRLLLPKHMKIHPVFHATLLTPYVETTEYGTNFTRPPPDIIEDSEEFEVEEICGVRRHGKKKTWQYLVKWKGYPNSESTWEPLRNLKRSLEYIEEWHQTNPKQPKPDKLSLALAKIDTDKLRRIETAFIHVAIKRFPIMARIYKDQ